MFAKTVKVAVPFVWFGMVLAISFMEAPLKFQAPGITIPLGLGIGRLVFFALNKMELVCAILLLIALVRDRNSSRIMYITFGAAILTLLLETVWVLPMLNVRTDQVIAGTASPFSNTHIVYIAFDALKLVSLMVLGIATTRQLIAGSSK